MLTREPPLAPAALDFLRSCKPRQFPWPEGLTPKLSARFVRPGYLCLYAGNRGVAKEVMKPGVFYWALTFDWLHGPGQDLLDANLQQALLDAAEARCFAAAGLAPICASFSAAITPPVQTCAFPTGILLLCLLPWPSRLRKARRTARSSSVSLGF